MIEGGSSFIYSGDFGYGYNKFNEETVIPMVQSYRDIAPDDDGFCVGYAAGIVAPTLSSLGTLAKVSKVEEGINIIVNGDKLVVAGTNISLNAASADALIESVVNFVSGTISYDNMDNTKSNGESLNNKSNTNKYGIDVDNLQFSETVQGHTNRPYQNSKLLIKEIIEKESPIPDPQGTGALYWRVEGDFNGSTGIYELLIDPKTNTVWHFVYKSI